MVSDLCALRRCPRDLYRGNSLSNASTELGYVVIMVVRGLFLVSILVGMALIDFAHGIVRVQISEGLAVRYAWASAKRFKERKRR